MICPLTFEIKINGFFVNSTVNEGTNFCINSLCFFLQENCICGDEHKFANSKNEHELQT